MQPTAISAFEKDVSAVEARFDELLQGHEGQILLFKNGVPAGYFDNPSEAYAEGIRRFGVDGGFVMREMRREVVSPVSIAWQSGVMFG